MGYCWAVPSTDSFRFSFRFGDSGLPLLFAVYCPSTLTDVVWPLAQNGVILLYAVAISWLCRVRVFVVAFRLLW